MQYALSKKGTQERWLSTEMKSEESLLSLLVSVCSSANIYTSYLEVNGTWSVIQCVIKTVSLLCT